jgi:superfamily I DNA/RNA helicase
MKPKFISGPPGTGKTNFFIKEKYEELVKQYGHEKIIILSHTNVAADEIREVILNLPLMKEKGVRKKALEHKICTIHHYCKHKLLRKDVFSEEDFSNLVIETGERSSLFSKDEKNLDKHKFFRFLNDAHGNGYYDNLHEFWNKRTTDRRSYKYKTVINLK